MGELERATRSTESKPPRPTRSRREVVRSSPELGERAKWEEGWFSLGRGGVSLDLVGFMMMGHSCKIGNASFLG